MCVLKLSLVQCCVCVLFSMFVFTEEAPAKPRRNETTAGLGETHQSSTNGYELTTRTQRPNMHSNSNVFLLPRKLDVEDAITIKGNFVTQNRRYIAATLYNESQAIFRLTADFHTTNFTIETFNNGTLNDAKIPLNYNVTDLMPVSEPEFKFTLKMVYNISEIDLNVLINDTSLEFIRSAYDLRESTHIGIEGDVEHIQEISFKFHKPEYF